MDIGQQCAPRTGSPALRMGLVTFHPRLVADSAHGGWPVRPIARFAGTSFLLLPNLGRGDGQVFEHLLPFTLCLPFQRLAMQDMVQFGDQMLLSPGDFCQRRHRFHQRQNLHTLHGRSGGEIKVGCGLHGAKLGSNPRKNLSNDAVDPLRRSR